MLSDALLKRELFQEVDDGNVAEWAVKLVIERFAAQFAVLQDAYLYERAGDFRALSQRLLFHLDDIVTSSDRWLPHFILVADELTATLLADVLQDRLAGVVVHDGAANSHSAIMVRAMGITTLIGADIPLELLHQRSLILDGYRGELLVDPDPTLLQEYQRLLSEDNALTRLAEDDMQRPAVLTSGESMQVMLNAGLSAEYEQRFINLVDGVGLYRTEVPFMKCLLCYIAAFPLKMNRWRSTKACCSFIPHGPVVLRTLDIGADKQLPYLPISEENPCLGWRGIRVTLDHL